MKVDLKTRRDICQKLGILLNHIEAEAKKCETKTIKELWDGNPSHRIGIIFDLWHYLYACIKYNTENPNCIKKDDGSRLFAQDFNWDMYPCNTNDDSLKTALVWCFKELGYSL